MGKTTFDLAELRRRAADRRGGDTLTITAGGKPFSIPAPGFWPDSLKAAAQKIKDTGDLPFARELMGGGKRYAEFVAAGGRADDLLLLIDEHKRAQGAELGESSPSPTS